ncbi:MAG TPA: hypothetical protein VH639_20470 [Bryobacteraceae bacterium]|jgi:predicted nuclease of predicted toxin-antitoxin system
MRILLDECVNPRLRLAFPGDEVKTISEMDWRSMRNGQLLKEAAGRFDVFITLDQSLQSQNPIHDRPIGVLVLVTPFNDLATYRPHFARIRDSARRTKAGQVKVLEI